MLALLVRQRSQNPSIDSRPELILINHPNEIERENAPVEYAPVKSATPFHLRENLTPMEY